MEHDLLTEIRDFLKSSGMGPTYFGKIACGNSNLIRNLEKGGTVTLRNAARIKKFISEYQLKSSQAGMSSHP